MKRTLLGGIFLAMLGAGLAYAGGREAPPKPPTGELRPGGGGGGVPTPPIRHEAPLGPRDPRHPEPPPPAK
jgi:hypothetical protein